MDWKRKVAMLGVTVAVAGATGHVMQRTTGPEHPAMILASSPAPARLPSEVREPRLASVDFEMLYEYALLDISEPAAERAVPSATPEPLELAAGPDSLPETLPDAIPPLQRLALSNIIEEPENEAVIDRAAVPHDACDASLMLAAAPGAMIDIAFDAPCHPMARIVIRHAGMAVTGLTSATGTFDLTLPALRVDADVTADVRGGPIVFADVAVPDFADYDRVVVQWQGADSFELHAYEFGASFGEFGHVWSQSPRGPDAADLAEGGFLTALGDRQVDWPLLAEVYSLPTGRIDRAGDVRLSVEAAVTPETCGREMLGEAIVVQGGQPPALIEITLPMPGCDVSDGFLVLNNLLPNLNIAGN